MEALLGSRLFREMDEGQIQECLRCSGAKTSRYQKEDFIFRVGEPPRCLFVLLEGAVAVCRDSASGKRIIVNTFHKPGELFGEVFAFLPHQSYPNYTVAQKDCVVLGIPKEFFVQHCGKSCGCHVRLIQNMLTIMAEKTFLLSQKLHMVLGRSLRQKIARVLLDRCGPALAGRLDMNREELADFLGATRPSLSRELMKMSKEGLIEIRGDRFAILELERLEQFLD